MSPMVDLYNGWPHAYGFVQACTQGQNIF